jgi:hypothetical protein
MTRTHERAHTRARARAHTHTHRATRRSCWRRFHRLIPRCSILGRRSRHTFRKVYIYTHIVCMYTYTLSICIYTLNICIFFVRLRTPGFDGRRGSGKRSGRRWSSSGKRQKF